MPGNPQPRINISLPAPSIVPNRRLKLVLSVLTLAVLGLTLLALSAARGTYFLLPSGGVVPWKRPATGHLELNGPNNDHPQPHIDRDFEEPDYALLTGRQPHEFGCDIPLDGPAAGVLLFVGIFSSPNGRVRRDLLRKHYLPEFPPHVTVKFILGREKIDMIDILPAGVLRGYAAEEAAHGDMVVLDIPDNIDDGKTHAFFQHVAAEYGRSTAGRPRFVVKTDDDTLFVVPNFVSAFAGLDCTRNVYFGTSAGASRVYGSYFRGLGYAFSWPLAAWLGGVDMPPQHVSRVEDARAGQWLRMLDPVRDPIERVDLGWSMGDFNQLHYTTGTMALHWLKWDEAVTKELGRIRAVWRDAGREWRVDNGVPLAQSIEEGRTMPQEAKENREDQKAAGTDT